METIKNYLDNVFQALPQTQEVLDLKDELLTNMEDKYDELKALGKTENEAIGIVISEFGNIDELLKEMDINTPSDTSTSSTHPTDPILSLEDARNFISTTCKSTYYTALGITLIFLGVISLIATHALSDAGIFLNRLADNTKDTLSVILLFLFLVPAIGLFIFADHQLERFKFIKEGNFRLSPATHSILSKEYAHISTKKPIVTIIGVGIILLSPVPILLGDLINDLFTIVGVCILLIMVAIAISLFMLSDIASETYKPLLQEGKFSPERKKESKVIGAVAAIVWPLTVAIFLLLGLGFNLWHINWLIFPITGVLFGGFCAFYSAISSK